MEEGDVLVCVLTDSLSAGLAQLTDAWRSGLRSLRGSHPT